MSENGTKHSVSSNGEKKTDEEVWKDSKISFELDNDRFLNNTIYGAICIKPEEARKLIGKFFLCNDDSQIHVRVKFESDAEYIKASGFDPTRKHLVYIEAVPKNENSKLPPKTSIPQELLITRQSFSITPVIHFSWPSPTQEDSKKKLPLVVIIKWFHIGDTIAEKYVVCLDNKEVRYIRDTLGKHMFEVRIHNFESEQETFPIHNIESNKKTHVFQIKARLNDDQDTHESDRINFIVPDKNDEEYSQFFVADKNNEEYTEIIALDKNDEEYIEYIAPEKNDEKKIEFEFISVSKANKPRDQGPKKKKAPAITTSPHDKKSQENHRLSSSQSKEQRKDLKPNATCSCCRRPHNEYPGRDHYFDMNHNKQSSSSLSERKTVVPDKRMSCSDKGRTNNDNHDDDDDDVVDGGPPANELTIIITK